MDDPKKRQQKDAPMEALEISDDTMRGMGVDQLIALIRAASGNDEESMRRRALFEAEAHQRLTKRENTAHPGISVYSHPEGDVEHPKDDLKCKMYWVGYPLEKDNLTPTEIAALNRATPGEFGFSKTDGSREKLTVKGQTDHTGALQQIEFNFPCRGDNRHNLPSMLAMLNEVYGGGSSEMDRLRAELATLRSQIGAAA